MSDTDVFYFYHGTTRERLASILEEGLLTGRQLREHDRTMDWPGLTGDQEWVHLSQTVEGAYGYPILSGHAHEETVVLEVEPVGELLDPRETDGVQNPGNAGDVLHVGPVPPDHLRVMEAREVEARSEKAAFFAERARKRNGPGR